MVQFYIVLLYVGCMHGSHMVVNSQEKKRQLNIGNNNDNNVLF